MTVAHIDYETFSEASLTDVGMAVYAKHPSTQILCMYWAIGDDEPKLWRPSMGPFPQQVKGAGEIHAHNASFERVITREVIGLSIPPKRFRCSASRATQAGLPRSLEGSCSAIGSAPKDSEGHALMLKMCCPDKKGEYIKDAQSMLRLFEYCKQDVIAERDLESRLPTPPLLMQRAWGLHEVINDRGVPIDRSVCEGAKKILAEAVEVTGQKASDLTGEQITSGRQVKRIKEFVNERGVNIDNLKEETLLELLPSMDEDDVCTKVLQLRQAMSAAAPAKFEKALISLCDDDRLHDVYVFPGAHTGRATSFGVQLMNFKKSPALFGAWCDAVEKGDEKAEKEEWGKINSLIEAIRSGSLGTLIKFAEKQFDKKDRLRNAVALLGNSVRTMVTAPEGKTFVLADLSQIEMRVAHWLSGNKKMMDLFAGGGDPYIDFASHFFKTHDVSKAQRQRAKPICLGGNYGMGPSRLMTYAKIFGLELSLQQSEEVIGAYRARYANIPRLWQALERNAIQCVLDGRQRRVHLVRMGTQRQWFYLELPSGRRLWYFKPEIIEGSYGPAFTYRSSRNFRKRTWGGSFTENLAQAITADITNAAMIRAEESGLRVVLNQHDEVGVEESESNADSAAEELANIMAAPPEWAVGLPIAAESEKKKRWLK